MNTLIAHVQQNAAAYAVGAVAAIVIAVVFRKWVLPFLYHTVEYLMYCTVVHFFLGAFVRVFAWFREETEFKNYSGQIDPDWAPYTTPLSLDFWQMKLYNPHWLFWFEIGLAALLLYVVIVIRPTRLKRKAVQSKRPKPGARSATGASDSYTDRLRAAGRGMKSARSR